MRCVCPSGLVINARPWNLGDQRHLLEQSTVEQGLLPLAMAKTAFEAVIDPGPYKAEPGSDKVDWDEMTVSDITAINYQVRAQTRPNLDFDQVCPHCGKMQHLSVPLQDVDTFAASDAGIEHIRDGAPLEVEAPSFEGPVKVFLKLMRGRDLPTLARWQEKDSKAMMELQACMSIESVVVPGRTEPIKGVAALRQLWRKMPWDFGKEITDAIDDAEGGVDSAYTYRCKDCRKEMSGSLPLDVEFYGLDSPGKRKPRRKISLEQV